MVNAVDDLLQVPDAEMNTEFRAWKAVLKDYSTRGPLIFRRLEFGDNDAFNFFNNSDLRIDVLGPSLTELGNMRGLRFLGEPPKGPRIGHESLDTDVTEAMASETWLLESGHYQIEVMANLDQVPATGAIIVVTWPKVENGFGFPARAFAILP